MSETNPNRSNLDQQQIFQRAFNEDLDRIRVDAEISASIIAPPGLEVSITSIDDSILIVGTEDATTTGTQHVVKVNSDGSLDVNAAVTLPANASINLNQIVGTTASVNNGTADAGTLRVAIASDNSPISVTQSTSPWVVSGTVTSNIGTTGGLALDTTVSGLLTDTQLRASPVPVSGSISFSSPQYVIVDSGTLTSITNVVHVDDNGGSLTVDNNGTFAVQAAQSGTWNINNISGTISLPTGASTSANQTTINTSIQALQVAQGSTTSGELGPLVQGAVTTSAPTYITGQTNPLSLTTAGALRVDGSGTTQPISGTVTANQGTSPWVVSGSIITSPDVNVHDGTGVSISSTGSSLNVDVTNTVPVTGTFFQATQPISGSVSISNFPATQAVTQSTSPWVVSGTVTTSTSNDTNYGVVGANTLRTAAQIGNSLGAALFGAGTTTAQVLRVVLPTDQTAIPASQSGSWTVTANQGTSPWVVSGTVTSNIGTTGGLALDATVAGLLTDTQLRASPVPVSGTVTVSNFPTTLDTNYGTVGASTLRTAAQIGNATGAANFNAGTTTAQTLRVVLPTDQTSIPVSATQSGTWNIGTLSTITNVVHVDDNGGSLTVDNNGTFAVQAAQSGTWILGANSGVDIGDVTINNAAGASAVNIQDGGNTITVDGTVTVNQGTSPWVVSGTVTTSSSNDTNYGAVGANTLRTAAQIGNATGAADFNAGATGAQTLRVVANAGTGNFTVVQPTGTNLHTVIDSGTITVSNFPTTLDTNYGTVGANTLRTAAQIGNATGAALFGAGTTTAQVLRVVLPTDQTTIPVEGQSRSSATTTITGAGTAEVSTNGMGTVRVVISGTWTGVIQFECTVNGTNWTTCNGVDLEALNNQVPVSTTVNGLFAFDVSGTTKFMLRGNTVTGTANVEISASPPASVINAILSTVYTNTTVSASATNIAKAEDVLSANGDVGVPALAVRKATPANTSGTDGDYEFLQMSAGKLWTSASPVDSANADLTAAKNSQTSRFLGVQRSIDAGRNARHFMLDAYTAAPLVEAVQSVVQWYSNAAVGATTQPAVVPSGKTLRLISWSLSTKSLATVGSAVVRVRINTAGLGVLGSPLAFSFEAGSKSGATTVAMTGGLDTAHGSFPEGFEIPAGSGLAFSMAGYGPTGTLLLEGVTRFAVYGYEY